MTAKIYGAPAPKKAFSDMVRAGKRLNQCYKALDAAESGGYANEIETANHFLDLELLSFSYARRNWDYVRSYLEPRAWAVVRPASMGKEVIRL